MANFDPEIELWSGLFDAPSREALKATRTPVPALPVVDDPLAELEPATGAADGLCERLETEDLISKACDLSVPEVRKITACTPEPLTFAKSLSQRERELNTKLEKLIFREVNSALIPIKATVLVEARKADLAKGDGARRAVLTKMLRPLRSLFRTPPEARFERLTDAMAAFVTDRIVDEA
jgi:hypothetical protein